MAKGQGLLVPIDVRRQPAALTGARDPLLAERLLTQVAESLWLPEEAGDAERVERIRAAAAALEGLAPRDELEGMLAAQMVATHAAAMESLRRAIIPIQDGAIRADELRQAARLLALYAKQVEALNRNRGQGQRKVTVEHVRVESGGQAIVGHVTTEARPGGPG